MENIRHSCPKCGSNKIIKNGTIRIGTPKWKCKDCEKSFSKVPKHKKLSKDEKEIINKLLPYKDKTLTMKVLKEVFGIKERAIQVINKKRLDSIND